MKNAITNIIDASYLPKTIKLTENHYAIFFPLMKLLPAMRIIEKGIEAGLIGKNTHILESSSGTFAKGLAMVCNLKKLKLTIVSDNAIDESFRLQLEDLGSTVEIVAPVKGQGIQFARLERLKELIKQYPDHYWPCQYNNEWNKESYWEIGEMIIKKLGLPDYLVGAVGSGGSTCGITSYLRKENTTVKTIAVDTHNSILFGQKDGKRILRGLGNSIMPANLIHNEYDEVHWVTAKEAFLATRVLHQTHSIFAGPTAGASFMVSRYIAAQNKTNLIVSIFADEGWRYANIYNNKFLADNDLSLLQLPDKPIQITHPNEANTERWCMMQWNRQTLEEIINNQKNLTVIS
jgi:cysteine synthase A